MQRKVKPGYYLLAYLGVCQVVIYCCNPKGIYDSVEKLFLFAQFISLYHYNIGNQSRCGYLFVFNEVC